jgi:hypothetical protein
VGADAALPAAEVPGSQSQGDPTRMWKADHDDPWDGRDSRELTFVGKLRDVARRSEINNLDPILNRLRTEKSAAEIAVIREATLIAGLGIMRRCGMRSRGCVSMSYRGMRSLFLRNTGRSSLWQKCREPRDDTRDEP